MESSFNYTPTSTIDYGHLAVGPTTTPDILFVQANPGREVIRITPTGDLYWNGRLVETDDDFKAAMLDLAEHFKGRWF